MILAMVRKVVTKKNAALVVKDQRIRLLEKALMLALQQRFGNKIEMLSGLQQQLFKEFTKADIAAAETQLNALLRQGIMKKKNYQLPTR